MKGAGTRVLIGDDSALTSELDFSLVACTYGTGDKPLGTLGIFGPSRMEYQKMIPLVHFLGETLSRALVDHVGGAPEKK
jgi:heat-inducible transcriptional repressor